MSSVKLKDDGEELLGTLKSTKAPKDASTETSSPMTDKAGNSDGNTTHSNSFVQASSMADSNENKNKEERKNNEKAKEKKGWFAKLKNEMKKTFSIDDDKYSSRGNDMYDEAYYKDMESALEKYVYFWLKEDTFSQCHESEFEVDGLKFCNAEQYMMYNKAEIFGDSSIKSKILKTSDPRKIKEYGRKVSNFNEPIWRSKCLYVVKNGNIAKFMQNQRMQEELFKTHPKILVEASPDDKIWGIGLYSDDFEAFDERKWKGHNLLGFILTEVRDELMCERRLIGSDQKKVYLEELTKKYCDELLPYTEWDKTNRNTEKSHHKDDCNQDRMILPFDESQKYEEEFPDLSGAKAHRQEFSVGEKEKEITDQLPKDIQQLDPKAITLFYKALKDGKEKVNNIRLMVVGMGGVGKTSLVNNLIWDFRKKITESRSTEGIDVHRCTLMTDGDWCLDKELKKVKYENRIQIVVSNNSLISEDTNSAILADDETASSHDSIAIKEKIALHKEDDIIGLKFAKQIVETASDHSEKSKALLDKSKNDVNVSVWDFAGQTLYYSTHQFFLNKRSIYIVVMDMTKGLKDVVGYSEGIGIWCGSVDNCTYLDIFKFWLNAIHMNSDYQSKQKTIKKSVILVGTRKDEMKGSDEEKENTMNSYFNDALLNFDHGSPIFEHIYRKRFLVNNLSPNDSAFAELRTEIISLAASKITGMKNILFDGFTWNIHWTK